MMVMKVTSKMSSALPAGDDGRWLSSRGLTCEPGMLMGMRARMAMMQMRMRRKKHCKPMMDQCRMWRTEGIVLESVMIGQYISDMYNAIMAMNMQWQAMYLMRRMYCNK
jgi:hypothetical protein